MPLQLKKIPREQTFEYVSKGVRCFAVNQHMCDNMQRYAEYHSLVRNLKAVVRYDNSDDEIFPVTDPSIYVTLK